MSILLWGNSKNIFSQEICSQYQGCITGVVLDKKTNQPLDFAVVRVYDQTGRFVAGSHTNEKGFYTIYDLKPGVYTMTATYVGFEKEIKENVDVQPDVTTQINFFLKVREGLTEIIIIE